MAESKSVTPALDLGAVRARLDAHRLVNVGSPIFYLNGHDAQDLEDIRALVAEVERLYDVLYSHGLKEEVEK